MKDQRYHPNVTENANYNILLIIIVIFDLIKTNLDQNKRKMSSTGQSTFQNILSLHELKKDEATVKVFD